MPADGDGVIRRVVVTLGTAHEFPFRRMLDSLVPLLRPEGALEQKQGLPVEVLWQTGCTDTNGLDIDPQPFVAAAELDDALAHADLVVSHAGTGSALSTLRAGRLPLLVPRSVEHGELGDDHQDRFARDLERRKLARRVAPDEIMLDDLLTRGGAAHSSRRDPSPLRIGFLMSIRTIDPTTDSAWRTLMTGEHGNLFGSPPWIDALVATYDFDVFANVLEDASGTPTAGFTYARVRDFLGERLVSLPFSDYLDPVLANDDDWNALVAPVLDLGLPLRVRVRDTGAPRTDARFPQTGELAWHSTDLQRDEDEIFASFASSLRQNVRAARKRGVTIQFSSDLDAIRILQELHQRTRKRKYGLLAQPRSFFENIWKAFSPNDSIVVGTAIHEGDVIAVALYLVWNDVMYYKIGASVAERLSVRPNELLAWESLCMARERGLRLYDWGISDIDQPGLVGYKRKFATDERTVSILHHRPATAAEPVPFPGPQPGEMLHALTELFTRPEVPDEVTQAAGDVLYRYFA